MKVFLFVLFAQVFDFTTSVFGMYHGTIEGNPILRGDSTQGTILKILILKTLVVLTIWWLLRYQVQIPKRVIQIPIALASLFIIGVGIHNLVIL